MVQHKPLHEPGDFFKSPTRSEAGKNLWRPSAATRLVSAERRLPLVADEPAEAGKELPAAAGKELLCPGLRSPCNKLQACLLVARERHVARDRSGDQRDERQGTRGGPKSGCEDGGSCGSDDGAASAEDSQVLDADGAGTRQLASTTLDKRMEKSGGGRGAVGRVSTPDQVCLSWDSELSWCVHW